MSVLPWADRAAAAVEQLFAAEEEAKQEPSCEPAPTPADAAVKDLPAVGKVTEMPGVAAATGGSGFGSDGMEAGAQAVNEASACGQPHAASRYSVMMMGTIVAAVLIGGGSLLLLRRARR